MFTHLPAPWKLPWAESQTRALTLALLLARCDLEALESSD